MEEIATGSKARMRELARSLNRLQEVGLAMVKALWSDAVEPTSISRPSRWLEAGSSLLDAWHASAARAGAYIELHLAKSWYKNLDLGRLAVQHADTEAELVAIEDEVQVRANDIATFSVWNEFSVDHEAYGNMIPEDPFQLLFYGADGSSNEMAFEDATSSDESYADSATKDGPKTLVQVTTPLPQAGRVMRAPPPQVPPPTPEPLVEPPTQTSCVFPHFFC
ncbi:hypothetical protein ZWY2020_008182 [Hordeum vulgare]|nr:hypothetical protein ZWY2020_008182 [Hordeum vulgare]